ncbi:MAG: SUMF1/EgtB/PvdO family nonheme iron enzyme [Neomegalonema sp.]|nr:SUMF1/EgtB/PvdO family nonheme iron enzyme [Neomegalonema sp.]
MARLSEEGSMVRWAQFCVGVAALALVIWGAAGRGEWASAEPAPRRLALVIGNGAYTGAHLIRLPNPTRDADAVKKMLDRLKFDDVVLATDLTTAGMRKALRQFRKSIAKGPVEIAAVFFAGHAIQFERENYLFGVDAEPETVADLPGMAVSLQEILANIAGAKGLKLVMLDACRDEATLLAAMKAQEPNKTRSASLSRGLARLERYRASDDTLIAYATSPDKVALDGVPGAHSPFTQALLELGPTPGKEIRLLFGAVRDKVARVTAGRQKPTAKTDTMGGREYYLVPAATRPKPVPIAAPKPKSGLKDFETFRDCADCPEMVAIPAGSFLMGSPKTELKRDEDEGPQRRVAMKAFAIGKYEVTVGQYRKFVKATDRKTDKGCWIWTGSKWEKRKDASWEAPGFTQTDAHPVTCVSWADGQAYVAWLSKRTGQAYRLPSEAEWEYAARAGTRGPFSFTGKISADKANYDASYSYDGSPKGVYRGKTLAVGSFKPNPWGLYDVHGNVWEWVQDCWHESYKGAPTDGSAWMAADKGDCSHAVLRGGSWYNDPIRLRSADRLWLQRDGRFRSWGFRVARTIIPS